MENQLLKEYIKFKLFEAPKKSDDNSWMRKPFITWGEIKNVISKTKEKAIVKSFINKAFSKVTGAFMGINFPGTGEITEELITKLMKKINNADTAELFIALCVKTNVFGQLTKKHEKALRALQPDVIKKVLNNMLVEMKSVSNDTNIENYDFTKRFNAFFTPEFNLQIVK